MCSFWKGYYFQKLIIFQLSRDQVGSEILKTKKKGISCNLIKRFLQNENKVILLTMVLLTQDFQWFSSTKKWSKNQNFRYNSKYAFTLPYQSDFGNDLQLMISKMILFIFQKIKKAQKAPKNDQKNLGH